MSLGVRAVESRRPLLSVVRPIEKHEVDPSWPKDELESDETRDERLVIGLKLLAKLARLSAADPAPSRRELAELQAILAWIDGERRHRYNAPAHELQPQIDQLVAKIDQLHPDVAAQIQPYVGRSVPEEKPAVEAVAPTEEQRIDATLRSVNPRILPPTLRARLESLKYIEIDRARELAGEITDELRDIARVIPILVNNGIVSYEDPTHPETSRLFVDVAALREQGVYKSGISKIHDSRRRNRTQEFSGLRLLMAAFLGKEVIDTRDPRHQSKPLFFTPQSPDDVLDLNRLKAAEFHLAPWEFKRAISWEDPLFPLADLHTNPPLTPQLVAFTTTLYHPKFAAAERDENGQLWMIDPTQSTPQRPFEIRFTGTALQDLYRFDAGQGNSDAKFPSFNTPVRFIRRYLKPLVDRGLIRETDVRMLSSAGVAEEFGIEKPVSGTRGFCMLRGVQYYFGAQALAEGWQVTEVAPGIGVAFVETNEGTEVKQVFRLLSNNEKRAWSGGWMDSVKRTNPRLTALDMKERTVDPTAAEFLRQLPGESHDQYQIRVGSVASFTAERQLKRELAAINPPIPWHQLGRREQLLATSAVRRLREVDTVSEEHLIRFFERCGLAGLRALQVVEYGQELAHTVVQLGLRYSDEKFSDPQSGETIASRLFARYEKIIDRIREIDEFLHDTFGNEQDFERQRTLIAEQLFQKGKELLLDFEKYGGDPKVTIQNLDNHDTALDLFGATFRVLYREGIDGRPVTLEDFKHVSLESKFAFRIPPPVRQEMLAIARENWKAQTSPAHLESLLERMQVALNRRDENVIVHQARYDGKLFSFVRFDKNYEGRADTNYVASWNLVKFMQKQSLGEAFFAATLQTEGETHRTVGYFDALGFVGTQHLGKFGFVATEVKRNYEGTGRTFVRIEREQNRRMPDYEYFRLTKAADIEALIRDGRGTSNDPSGVRIETYHFGDRFTENDPAVQAYLADVETKLKAKLVLTNLKWELAPMDPQHPDAPPRPTKIYAVFEPKRDPVTVE